MRFNVESTSVQVSAQVPMLFVLCCPPLPMDYSKYWAFEEALVLGMSANYTVLALTTEVQFEAVAF